MILKKKSKNRLTFTRDRSSQLITHLPCWKWAKLRQRTALEFEQLVDYAISSTSMFSYFSDQEYTNRPYNIAQQTEGSASVRTRGIGINELVQSREINWNYLFNDPIATVRVEKCLQCNSVDIRNIQHCIIVRGGLRKYQKKKSQYWREIRDRSLLHFQTQTVKRLIDASPITVAVEMKCNRVMDEKACMKHSIVSNSCICRWMHAIKSLSMGSVCLDLMACNNFIRSNVFCSLRDSSWNCVAICRHVVINIASMPGKQNVVIAPPNVVCMKHGMK